MSGTRKRKAQSLFSDEIRLLMFAHGDVQNPDPESVAVLEDILQGYLVDMCHDAAKITKISNRAKVKVDDFKIALRKDPKKLGRVEELLAQQKYVEKAIKLFKMGDDLETKSSLVEKINDNKVKSKGNDK